MKTEILDKISGPNFGTKNFFIFLFDYGDNFCLLLFFFSGGLFGPIFFFEYVTSLSNNLFFAY